MDFSKISSSDIQAGSIESKPKVATRSDSPQQSQNVKTGSDDIRLTEKETKQVVDVLNNMIGMTQTHLQFRYHEKTGEYYVQLVNNQNDEVVKEIPSKRMLDISAAMQDFIGLIVNKKA